MKVIYWNALTVLLIVTACQTSRKSSVFKGERGDTLIRAYTEVYSPDGDQAIYLEKSLKKKNFYELSYSCETEYLSKSTYMYSGKASYIVHWKGEYLKDESKLSHTDSISIATIKDVCYNGKKINCNFFRKERSASCMFPSPYTVVQTDSLFFYDGNMRLNRCEIRSFELTSEGKRGKGTYRELVNKTLVY